MVDFVIERLADAQPDIESLLPAQWAHTGDSEVTCKPNWSFYRQFEARQSLLLIMARDEGVPVGYMAAFIYPHPNAMQELVAHIPTYFVAQRPVTRGLVESRMMDFMLERLVDRGVFKIETETSADYSAGRLWELKGFKPFKIGYSLKLKKPAGAQYA